MCGITGRLSFRESDDNATARVQAATDALFLRGPDCGAVYNHGAATLGHRRLSILDTSSAGTQPMHDASGRYTLVFNGEIFNFHALSERYLGQVWERIGGPQSSSDTEVLLYLLIEHGPRCLEWLHGFFAFAFWDGEKRELLLARDRFGKKPLLYYHDEEAFHFASEMKALLEYDIPRELDYAALHQYFQLNYIPQPWSILRGVNKLPPGHFLRVLATGGVQPQPESYYTVRPTPEQYGKLSYEEAQQQLVRLVDEAVQERLIADVPLGSFLSGGIDSSVIVAMASRHTRHLATFSIGYKDNAFFDETRYAKLVADKYGTEHTVFSLSNADFLEHLEDVLDYLDEPFADSSALPLYILCKHTRKHVTVALSGDGGDEIFAGYNKHGAEWRVRQRSALNRLASLGAPLWKVLPKSRNHPLTNKVRQLDRFARGQQLSIKDRYWQWASLASVPAVNNLLSDEARRQVSAQALAARRDQSLASFTLNSDDYNEVLATDMNLVLVSDMLVKVDMMSMANSLEVRCPLLDYRIVDFAFSLPSSYKINGELKKRILQDAFRPMLPPELYNRPKHGFEIPLLEWFRRELWEMIDHEILDKNFIIEQGLFNSEATEALKRRLRSNDPGDSHATVWAFIVFQRWWKKYMMVNKSRSPLMASPNVI